MTPKRALLLATLVAGGLLILGWSQTWFVVTLLDDRRIPVSGSAAAPGVLATGLALLAVAVALTIAPRVLRYVLGVLGLGIGAVATTVTAVAIADPLGAALGTITTETGIAGRESITELIADAAVQPWPWAALVGGVLGVLAGAGVLATARRWPTAGARYDRSPAKRDDWEALTEGDDPTR